MTWNALRKVTDRLPSVLGEQVPFVPICSSNFDRDGIISSRMGTGPNTDGVFFVPFDSADGPSKLKYRVGKKSAAGSPDAVAMPICYDELDVFVPPGLRGSESKETLVYRIKRDDNVLLRPPDNSEVPRIGCVTAIFSKDVPAGSAKPRLRVRWYYHASDFLNKPSRATGEDELLETPHYNDVDADTVVGRCSVTSYQDYRRLVDTEKVNSFAAPVMDETGGDGRGIDRSDSKEGSCDGDDDNESSFGDNYASASTRYFVREFYDACKDAVAISHFEDRFADPAADIEDRSDSDQDSLDAKKLNDDSETDDSDFDAVVEESGTKRKRRRPKRRRTSEAPDRSSRPCHSGGSQLQFPVPDIDIKESLPCRDEEKKRVADFLRSAIEVSSKSASAAGRCLYISGVPGTGKTATVREIIGELRGLLKAGNIGPFEAIEVNGMTLADPNLLYSELYAAIVGTRGISSSRAQLLLEQRFASIDEVVSRGGSATNAREQGKCVIVVLDEMDVLVSRNGELLHKILDWSAKRNSRLAIVGIANTMDLPERLLAKSKSRMGDNRLVYAPYTKLQLQEILQMRLRDDDIVYEDNALNFASTKIAALSGDVRRALQICSRAASIAQSERGGDSAIVKIEHISKASEDMTAGARFVAVAQRSLNERLVLIATLILSRSMGAFDVDSATSVPSVLRKSHSIAQDVPSIFSWTPSTEELTRAVARLVACRVMLLERDGNGGGARVVVNMSPDDVIYALADDPIAKLHLHQK